VLPPAAENIDVAADRYMIFDGCHAESASVADINAATDSRLRMGECRAEADMAIQGTVVERHSVE